MSRFRSAIRPLHDQMEFIVEYHLRSLGVATRDESGAVSTETAVLTAGLVALALAGGAILIAKVKSNANAIPDSVTVGG